MIVLADNHGVDHLWREARRVEALGLNFGFDGLLVFAHVVGSFAVPVFVGSRLTPGSSRPIRGLLNRIVRMIPPRTRNRVGHHPQVPHVRHVDYICVGREYLDCVCVPVPALALQPLQFVPRYAVLPAVAGQRCAAHRKAHNGRRACRELLHQKVSGSQYPQLWREWIWPLLSRNLAQYVRLLGIVALKLAAHGSCCCNSHWRQPKTDRRSLEETFLRLPRLRRGSVRLIPETPARRRSSCGLPELLPADPVLDPVRLDPLRQAFRQAFQSTGDQRRVDSLVVG